MLPCPWEMVRWGAQRRCWPPPWEQSTGGKSCQPCPRPAGIHWEMLSKIPRAAPASTARWGGHAPRCSTEGPSSSSSPSLGELLFPWHRSLSQGWAAGTAVLSLHESHGLEAWPLVLPGAHESSVRCLRLRRCGATAAHPAPRPAPAGLTAASHSTSPPQIRATRLLASPPQPTACTGLFNDGDLISLHCTFNTLHPCKNQSELAGGGGAQPALAPARGSAQEQSPWSAFGTAPPTLEPKFPGTGLWRCGGRR